MTSEAFFDLFRLGLNPLELIVRGTAVYWFLFLLFRFVLRRDAGSIGVADILMFVLIADAAQDAMSGGYTTVTDGLLLVITIASWNWLIDWAGYHFKFVRHWVEAPPTVLVRHGRLHATNLRREMITVPELMAKLRESGIDKLDEVKMARLESDGAISVIKRRQQGR